MPGSFNPLHQIFTDENWIQDYIAQHISIPAYKHDKNLSLLEFCGKLSKGTKIINIAQAGMGKSTMMCQIAKRWMKENQMSNTNELPDILRFKQVYLIPVRLIHNHRETLERIITHDLNLLGHDKEGDVRRQLKFNSSDVLFLIDGYDEMSEKERKYTTINKLLSGEVAPNAAVLTTSRPHCLEYLKQCVTAGTFMTRLLELDIQVVKTSLRLRFPDDNPDMLMNILSDVPGDIYRIPFFFTVLCYIWTCRKNYIATSSEHHFRGVTDIMDAMWGLMLGIKEQKEDGCEHPQFYKSFRDGKLDISTHRLIKNLAELCFETVKYEKSTFDNKQLQKYQIGLDELGKFGIFKIDPVGKYHSFVHKLFIEHCAAFHLVGSNLNISELLGDGAILYNQHQCKNVILFAVGMESKFLSEIMNITYELHFIKGEALRIREVDLSYQVRLLEECTESTSHNQYCEYISRLPVRKDNRTENAIYDLPYHGFSYTGLHLTHPQYLELRNLEGAVDAGGPKFNGDMYASFLQEMGLRRLLNLLQSANPSNMSYRQGKPTLFVPKNDKKIMLMTPLLLATLFATDVTIIPKIYIWWSHQKILELTKTWTVSYIFYNYNSDTTTKCNSVLFW